jgi:cobalt/nickel transport system permease protein
MPLLGLAGAFIFAAQMLNFPVAGGTSGHLMGGPLAAVLLGPGPAVVVMTCLLIVQSLMFADGGLTALGANVFNMGIVAVGCGYLAFRLLRKFVPGPERRVTVFAAAFGGWVGTVLSSIVCAGQLAAAGSAPWHTVFPAMLSVHMLIGIGEGLATGLIVAVVVRTRPELLTEEDGVAADRGVLAYGALVACGLALFVAPFACSWPDGLETVAAKLGIQLHSASHASPVLAPDYQLPFIGSPAAATGLAGILGTVLAFLAAYVLARLLVPDAGRGQHDASTGK